MGRALTPRDDVLGIKNPNGNHMYIGNGANLWDKVTRDEDAAYGRRVETSNPEIKASVIFARLDKKGRCTKIKKLLGPLHGEQLVTSAHKGYKLACGCKRTKDIQEVNQS